MQASAKDIVERLIRAGGDQEYGAFLELVDPNFFSQTSDGRIYIGHRGMTDWIRDFARDYSAREFIVGSVRELDDGFVVVRAMESRTTLRGEDEVVPGAWLFHVAGATVTSCVYFRTEADALQAISGPARGASPSAVIERNIAAHNRRDIADVVSLMRPDIRFSSSGSGDDVQEGIEALARHLAGFDDARRDVLIESHRLTELGDGFVLVEAVVRIDDEGGAMLDRRPVVYLARVTGGQIAEWIVHPDAESARAAAKARSNPVMHEPGEHDL